MGLPHGGHHPTELHGSPGAAPLLMAERGAAQIRLLSAATAPSALVSRHRTRCQQGPSRSPANPARGREVRCVDSLVGGTFLGHSRSGWCQPASEGSSQTMSALVLLHCKAIKSTISSFSLANRQMQNPLGKGSVNSASNPMSVFF